MQFFRATFNYSKINQGSKCPTLPFLPANPCTKHFAKEAKLSHSHKSDLPQCFDSCQSIDRPVLGTQWNKSLGEQYSYPCNKKTITQPIWTKDPNWSCTRNPNFNVFRFSGVGFCHFNSIILTVSFFCVFMCWIILSRPKFCLQVYNKLQEDNYPTAISSYLRSLSIYFSNWYAHRKANLLIKFPFLPKAQMECRKWD